MLSPHWANILGVLDNLLAMLRASHVPNFLIRKLFQQLFSFINVQLFNQLLLRRECCSFSNGEYVKTGLAEVEVWLESAGEDWVGQSWEELRFIRQVSTAFPHKPRLAQCRAPWPQNVGGDRCCSRSCALLPWCVAKGGCIEEAIGAHANAGVP